MSKFKVGDKVWFNGDVRIIRRVDEWEDGEYGYYFNVDDELLDYAKECDLELYKTPQERLLELGWTLVFEDDDAIYYGKYSTLTIRIDKKDKDFFVSDKMVFNLELAEILVDYLRELENDNKRKKTKEQKEELE